jgi:eukaryotic-like serine/threonine-protein kinase
MGEEANKTPLVGAVEAHDGAKVVIIGRAEGTFNLGTRGESEKKKFDRRNRAATIKRVRADWIEGLLRNSLENVARIELTLTSQPNSVSLPLNVVVQSPDRPPEKISAGTHISNVFDKYEQSLLILGPPGSGKTTLLLELAEVLLQRAEDGDSQPIPLIFNLSSWAANRKPLALWMVDEMNRRSDIPRQVASEWTGKGEIIPLLDGLDEVDAAYRLSCLQAINKFRSDYGLLPIAVCSRVADYEDLRGEKLQLRHAVIVQTLQPEEVMAALSQSSELGALQEAVGRDATFAELLRTPLMLWIAILAYRSAAHQIELDEGIEGMRTRLFATYVAAMFKRRGVSKRYAQENTCRWLVSLARSLERNKLTIFTLEGLSPSFFNTRWSRYLVQGVTCIGVAVIYVVVCFIVTSFGYTLSGTVIKLASYFPVFHIQPVDWGNQFEYMQVVGSIQAVTVAPVIGIIAAFIDLQPTESINLGLRNMSKRVRRALVTAVSLFLLMPLAFTIVDSGDYQYQSVSEFFAAYSHGFARKDLLDAGSSLWMALLAALFCLVLTPTSGERSGVNQGIRRSIAVALTMTGLVTLIGVLVAMHGGLFQWLSLASVTLGLAGGLFVIKHYVLRGVVWATRTGPLNYPGFLEYAHQRILLRRVGGSFVFVHRMLQEYFASQGS